MGEHLAEVDAYIARAAPFARPVLEWLRVQVHAACPDMGEAIKWGMPAFVHDGRLVASMGAFKAHVAFAFRDREVVAGQARAGAMGQFGRLRGVDDLPEAEALRALVRDAVARGAVGMRGALTSRQAPRPLPALPDALRRALDAHPAARAAFDGFTPAQRREYIEWVAGARREDTRTRRIAQAIEWLAQGRTRHWKYRR